MPESLEKRMSSSGRKWIHVSDATKLIEEILHEAILRRASDIHIDPQNTRAVSVRFRLDGLMADYGLYPIFIHNEVIGRVKILSALRTDIHDRSQDNTFGFTDKVGGEFDVRVSIAPTYFGENVVMRLIARALAGKENEKQGLTSFGLSERDLTCVLKALSSQSGMIVIAGPTGSGKTSTLYAMLQHLWSANNERMIVTIEDPVERAFEGIRQIQMSHERGFGFHQALRGIMRQDPDVIMVGEMRDKETASAAIHAALSGHLLLTTIHAQNASSILPRLTDMGIDPYLLASTATLLMSQRLVRRSTDAVQEKFSGRIGIFEVMEITDHIRTALMSRASAQDLEKIALNDGMTTMQQDGIVKSKGGMTTMREIARVLDI